MFVLNTPEGETETGKTKASRGGACAGPPGRHNM
jgi:hypothetical protein